DEALAMARRLDDGPTLSHVLYQRHDTIWHPRTLEERLGIALELAQLSEELGDLRGRYYAALVGIGPALEAADLDLVDRRLELAAHAAEQLREPPLRWFVLLPRATRATIGGDLEV